MPLTARAAEVALEPAASGGFSDFGGFGGGGEGGFNDIFDMFFGGAGARHARQPGPERGNDLRYDLSISFEDAAFGKKVELEVPRTVECPTCHGSGAAAGTSPETCPHCHGTGQQQVVRNTAFGRMMSTQTCQHCHARARSSRRRARTAMAPYKRETSKVTINIPKGVDQGSRVRLSGAGEAARNGGGYGDSRPHLCQAAQALRARATTSSSKCRSPSCRPLSVARYRCRRSTVPSTSRSRLASSRARSCASRDVASRSCVVRAAATSSSTWVLTPQNLSGRQKELLREFGEISGDKVNPEQKSFLDDLKRFFKK